MQKVNYVIQKVT